MRRMRSRHAPTLIFALLAAVTTTPPCRAEWLYFKSGGEVQAPVERQGNRVWVVTPKGRYRFHEEDFRKIVPGGCPDQAWETRRKAVLNSGAEGQFSSAWWALENGLVPEAVAMLRSAHAADPAHEPTARLVATLDRLDRPCIDPDTGALSKALGVSCEVSRGAHVLLLHQHDSAEARERIDLLERVTTAYYLLFSAQGFDLVVPSRRLVSVYLRDPGDYLAFLRSQGLNAFRTTLGYYHPNFRAVITFDPRPPGKARSLPVPFPATARKFSKQDQGDAAIDPALSELERHRLSRDLDNLARSGGTAAHEMIHLLVNVSGLAPDPGEFPLWLHEGFAAQFEVFRGGRWAGVGRAHDLRLADWRSLPTPASLQALIVDTDFGHGYRRDLYAKSWALVYYLRKKRPQEFSDFLSLLRLPQPEPTPGDYLRLVTAFEKAFGGDLVSIESDWHAFMSEVKTPLETHTQAGCPRTTLIRPHRD